MTFIIGIGTFQSHCKSERNQEKQNQEKQNHTGHVQI